MVFILKNVKKLIYFIIISIVGGQMCASEIDAEVPYIRYAKEIMSPFIQKCEKEYKLGCIGTGGRFAKNVAEISIKFIAYRKGTIEEARVPQVIMTETLLAQVNSHENIRPFLNSYPFDVKDIEISISFRKNDDSRYSDGSVVYVSHIKNRLFYRSEDPKTKELIPIFDESYQEALNIINKSK
jgi:hypothetical protein